MPAEAGRRTAGGHCYDVAFTKDTNGQYQIPD